MKEIITNIVAVFLALMFVAGIVVTLSDIIPTRENNFERIEREFRAACTTVNGNATWNGRNWECLK